MEGDAGGVVAAGGCAFGGGDGGGIRLDSSALAIAVEGFVGFPWRGGTGWDDGEEGFVREGFGEFGDGAREEDEDGG